jgi:hypothetical protein
MSVPTPRQDAVAGAGVGVWVLGMGLVLGIDQPTFQIAGGVMWASGLLVAAFVAGQAYLRRDRSPD